MGSSSAIRPSWTSVSAATAVTGLVMDVMRKMASGWIGSLPPGGGAADGVDVDVAAPAQGQRQARNLPRADMTSHHLMELLQASLGQAPCGHGHRPFRERFIAQRQYLMTCLFAHRALLVPTIKSFLNAIAPVRATFGAEHQCGFWDAG